jgi:hypothetical protein
MVALSALAVKVILHVLNAEPLATFEVTGVPQVPAAAKAKEGKIAVIITNIQTSFFIIIYLHLKDKNYVDYFVVTNIPIRQILISHTILKVYQSSHQKLLQNLHDQVAILNCDERL